MTAESEDDLARQLSALVQRIERIEEYIQIDFEGVPEGPEVFVEPAGAPSAPTDVKPNAALETLERLKALKQTERETAALDQTEPGAQTPHQPVPAAQSPTLATQTTHEESIRSPAQATNLEDLIGGKVFAIVGAIVVVAGVGFFVKLAYDQGWFGTLPDWLKCVSAAAFGLALIIAGEVARKRVSVWAAAGLSAAGVGAIYVAAYAAFGQYHLVSQATAFAMLVGTVALGVVVSTRARIVAVAIVSLIGGYLAPFLVSQGKAEPIVLAYCIALLVTGMALSGRIGGAFTSLRWLVWWATLLLGVGWTISIAGEDYPVFTLLFLVAAWCIVHAELTTAAVRGALLGGSAQQQQTDVDAWRQARPIALSFSASVWAGALATWILFSNWPEADWASAAIGCAATMALGAVLGGPVRVLRDAPATDRQRLAAALVAQSGAFLLVAIALAFGGWLQSTWWLALGLAAIFTGRRIRSKGMDVYGLVSLALGAVRMLPLVWWEESNGAPVIGFVLTKWALLPAIGGASWMVAGGLLDRKDDAQRRLLSDFCIGVGFVFLWLASLHVDMSARAFASSLLAAGAIVFAAGHVRRSKELWVFAFLWLIATSATLLLNQWWITSASEPSIAAMGLILTRWTPIVALTAFAWILRGVYDAVRQYPKKNSQALAHASVGAGVALLSAAFLHENALAIAISLLWLFIGVGVSLANRRAPHVVLPHISMVVLAAAMAAWAVAYPFAGWSKTPAPLALHPGLWSAALLVAVMYVVATLEIRRLAMPRAPLRVFCLVSMSIATLTLFTATSLEAARIVAALTDDPATRASAVSIWWGVFGVVMLALGFWRSLPAVRHVGLGVIAIAGAKAFIFDLATVPPVWRVVSFLGLGMAMLIVSIAYAKISRSFTNTAFKHVA